MTKPLKKQLPESFICISIVEDNHYLRSGWRAVLEGIDDFLILGDYESCEAAFNAPDIGESHVVLMDIGLPGMSGISGVRELTAKFPELTVIMITVHDDDQHIFEAICAGAVGYLLKSTSPEQLIQSIREAHAGGSPMTPTIARKVIASFQKSSGRSVEPPPDLNEVQRQVLTHLAQGKSYTNIAELMGLSVHGVRYHLRGIYEKLQVKSRSEAVAKGLKARLIPPLRD